MEIKRIRNESANSKHYNLIDSSAHYLTNRPNHSYGYVILSIYHQNLNLQRLLNIKFFDKGPALKVYLGKNNEFLQVVKKNKTQAKPFNMF